MIATGIVRRLDDLGRIWIPKELRKKLFDTHDTTGIPMEFFYESDDNTIIIKPYQEQPEHATAIIKDYIKMPQVKIDDKIYVNRDVFKEYASTLLKQEMHDDDISDDTRLGIEIAMQIINNIQ